MIKQRSISPVLISGTQRSVLNNGNFNSVAKRFEVEGKKLSSNPLGGKDKRSPGRDRFESDGAGVSSLNDYLDGAEDIFKNLKIEGRHHALDAKDEDEDKENFPSSQTSNKFVAPYVRGRPSACVFVASLSSNCSDDELCVSVTDLFRKWGKLSSVKVLRDTLNRPYAFVQFTNDIDCKLAITNCHNLQLNGRRIRCEHAKVNRTLFINSFENLSESEIRAILGNFGEIERLAPSDTNGALSDDQLSGKLYDCWYCKFVFRDDAIRAFANLTEGGIYKVEWTQNINTVENEKHQEIEDVFKFDKYSIFIGQLSQSVTFDELSDRFTQYGSISNLDLIKKSSNTFAFVKYKDESSAASAVERENHSMLCGKTMHVQYREFQQPALKNTAQVHKGIAHAPPPINLTKRSVSGGSNRSDSLQRKGFNASRSRFPGKASFNYNRRSSSNSHTTPIPKYGETYRTLSGSGHKFSSSANKSEGPSSFTKTTPNVYSYSALAIEDDRFGRDRRSPPSTGKEIGANYKHSGSSCSESDSAVSTKGENAEGRRYQKAPPSNAIINGNSFPYFYYIPTDDQAPIVPVPTAEDQNRTSYYYPEYFFPYGTNQLPAEVDIDFLCSKNEDVTENK